MPNPWNESTSIAFTIPDNGEVKLVVKDITGKLIMSKSDFYQSGSNTFTISNADIDNPGVYLYEVNYNGKTINKRMIKVR